MSTATLAGLVNTLQDEIERLKAIIAGCDAEGERDRAEIERLTRERDAAVANFEALALEHERLRAAVGPDERGSPRGSSEQR